MFGKKKTLGVQPKIRTIDQINQDYNHHAAQVGHKSRIIEEIQREIETHIQKLHSINVEARSLPKENQKPPAPPAQAPVAEDQEHA